MNRDVSLGEMLSAAVFFRSCNKTSTQSGVRSCFQICVCNLSSWKYDSLSIISQTQPNSRQECMLHHAKFCMIAVRARVNHGGPLP